MRASPAAAFLVIIFLAVAASAADLGVSASTIDYGTVKEGPPVIKTVTLTNNGTQTLTIANAAAS
jgi:hypothetical protein